jgi:hypothetical protein
MTSAAHIAFIAPGCFAAVGAFALDVSVRKESLAFGTVCQLDLFRIDVALIHEDFYEFLRAIVAGRIVRVAKEIEVDAHALEDLVEVLVISGYECLRLYSLGLGINDDGRTVSIRAADEEHIPAHLPQSSYEDVRRYISSEMA